MYSYSAKSKRELESCHGDIQIVLNEVIKYMDCSVLKGHRAEREQNQAFEGGFSRLKFPLSRHNKLPSDAVDVVPFPIDWDDLPKFHELAGVIRTVCKQKGIKLEWGGEWKSFRDAPHWQIPKEESNGIAST